MSRLGKTGRRALAAAVATFMMLAVAVAVPTSAGAAGQGGIAAPQGGMKSEVIRGVADDGRKVRATVLPTNFEMVGDQLVADVLVRGVATGKGGREVATQVIDNVPVQINTAEGLGAGGAGMAGTAVGSCDILNLVLGPLDLDILGLQVHLDQVVLDIVAQSGAGNLLGNLLCAVAGLLDDSPLDLGALTGLLEAVNGLLDQLLGGLLGGLPA